jgi:hypothetical protein
MYGINDVLCSNLQERGVLGKRVLHSYPFDDALHALSMAGDGSSNVQGDLERGRSEIAGPGTFSAVRSLK